MYVAILPIVLSKIELVIFLDKVTWYAFLCKLGFQAPQFSTLKGSAKFDKF